MSSEATSLTVTTRKRHSQAQYWTFFTKEDGPFWHFLARSREDLQTQRSPPPHKEMTGATGAPNTVQSSTAVCWSASPGSVS